MKPKECPKCESTDIGDKWCEGRKLQYYCRDCHWSAKPRIPTTKPIIFSKTVYVNQFYGFMYTLFDKYGYEITISRSYYKEEDAEAAMMKDLINCNKFEDYFSCTGILWPKYVEVKGKVFLGDGQIN